MFDLHETPSAEQMEQIASAWYTVAEFLYLQCIAFSNPLLWIPLA